MNYRRPIEGSSGFLFAILLVCLGPLAPTFALQGLATGLPRTEPDPNLVRALAGVPPADSGQPMATDDFARIALIASGADGSTVESLLARLRGLSAELVASFPAGASDWDRGDAALRFLYDRVLSRYSEFQTRVDLALETGDYNCVSSAILYFYFARAAGLVPEGVETPVHALCTVPVDGKRLDVETTNPYGFDPGTKRQVSGENANQTRYYVVPRSNYANRKPVGERRLLALVYSNRVSLLEKKGQFADAVGLALDSWTLQSTESARVDLAERGLNYATSVATGRSPATGNTVGADPLGALGFIDAITRLWGVYPRYREFAANAVGQALNDLMDAGDYAACFALLDSRGATLEPSSEADMRRLVASNYLSSFASTHTLAETLSEVSRYRGYLNDANYGKIVAFAYGRASEDLAREGKWLEAAAIIDQGLVALPGRPELTRARTTYRQNHAVEVHNQAAAAFNAGDSAGARAIVEAGLLAVPESAVLKQDLKRF